MIHPIRMNGRVFTLSGCCGKIVQVQTNELLQKGEYTWSFKKQIKTY